MGIAPDGFTMQGVTQRSRTEMLEQLEPAWITLNNYQTLSEHTMNFDNQTEAEMLSNVALGLAGEAGEFADTIKSTCIMVMRSIRRL